MFRLVVSSGPRAVFRPPTSSLSSSSFGMASRSSSLLSRSFSSFVPKVMTSSVAVTRLNAFTVPAVTPCRQFAKKTIDSEAVKNEKQKKAQFLEQLDEEISVLTTTLEDGEGTQGALRGELGNRFLNESGFAMTKNESERMVTLTRQFGSKTVNITFSSQPQNDVTEAVPEEEMAEEHEAAEAREDAEEGEEMVEEEKEEREHPFHVEITSSKTSSKVQFSCYASQSGSFTISELNVGDGKKIPVLIGLWNEELQTQVVDYLEQFGVTERLSYYIHQYVDHETHHDNLEILKEFKKFVQE